MEEVNPVVYLKIIDIMKVLRCSRQHVYKLIKQKKFPAFKINPKTILIPKTEFENWFRSCKV